jgi:hypothetical protein
MNAALGARFFDRLDPAVDPRRADAVLPARAADLRAPVFRDEARADFLAAVFRDALAVTFFVLREAAVRFFVREVAGMTCSLGMRFGCGRIAPCARVRQA